MHLRKLDKKHKQCSENNSLKLKSEYLVHKPDFNIYMSPNLPNKLVILGCASNSEQDSPDSWIRSSTCFVSKTTNNQWLYVKIHVRVETLWKYETTSW